MDPGYVVVKLCAEGMAAEADGCAARAKQLFAEAWRVSSDAYEACIAAHYLARHQQTAEEALRWNQEALRLADAAADERVSEFYPSLHLNVAYNLERLGRAPEAYLQYSRAAARLDRLPANGYMNMMRRAVAQGEARMRDATR